MKNTALNLAFLLLSFQAFSWGQTGHRVVGQVAENHLSKKAKKNIDKVLKGESLAMVSNWMDFIKSDSAYDYMKPWHYATIRYDEDYLEAGAPKQGDVIWAINEVSEMLKNNTFTDEIPDEVTALKILVHLVGDIHQPLHVGNGDDLGGNKINIQYFYKKSNLHSVWDTKMIDGQNLSYSEYTNWIDTSSTAQIERWQDQSVYQWALESQSFHPGLYDFPKNGKLSYRYNFDHIDTVNLRLLQGGIRLAGVLNEIYG